MSYQCSKRLRSCANSIGTDIQIHADFLPTTSVPPPYRRLEFQPD
jgi:hypothetical protein